MHSRWYNVAVVVLWVSTMTWLLRCKVLPTLLVGNPPSYPAILAAQKEEPVAGWKISVNGRPVGAAASKTQALSEGMTEVRNRVRFDHLPLQEILPQRFQSLLPSLDFGNIPLEAHSFVVFDSFGKLSEFQSGIGFDPKEDFVKIRGRIDGAALVLEIRHGQTRPQEISLGVPRNAMLNDSLSPQSRLPGLSEGQTWTVEIYSPLASPDNPTEVLQATVERKTPMIWNREPMEAWLVVYRSDPGGSLRNGGEVRGKLWVSPEGIVLRQEVMLFGAALTFDRLPEKEALTLADQLGVDRESFQALLNPLAKP